MKCFIFLFLIISVHCISQIKAVVKESGKEVNLFDDGTWKYAVEEPNSIVRMDTLVLNRSKESTKLIRSSKLNYGIWIDNKKWSCEKGKDGEPQELNFKLLGQDACGMIVSERIEIPMDNLVDIAVEHAEKVSTDTKIISNESRRVNGILVRFLQMEGTIQGIKFVYLGYYYSDKHGSIQFITYTSKNLLKDYRADMETLLNGFVLCDTNREVQANPGKDFEKKITINANTVLHYKKDIDEAVPKQIAEFMTKNGYISPKLTTEIYLDIENNTYKLKFVKDESVLNYKEVVFSFNVLELKLNSNLKLDKEIVIEFTSEDLNDSFALPHGSDIVNETVKEIFKLKIYHIDDFHTIEYNETMPLSELKKIGDAVKRLKYDFPQRKMDMIFLNNGSDYTLKFFVLKEYWNSPSETERCKRIIKYFKDCGIRKKINLNFIDHQTYEETKI